MACSPDIREAIVMAFDRYKLSEECRTKDLAVAKRLGLLESIQ